MSKIKERGIFKKKEREMYRILIYESSKKNL